MEDESADSWGIIWLSLAMLIGCYIAGSVPLSISLSESKIRFLAVLGAGLLVGTSLAVIIPEGIHALLDNGVKHQHHEEAPKAVIGPENIPDNGDANHIHENADAHSHTPAEDIHSLIGVALVFGFVFMLAVDQIGGGGGHSHSRPQLSGEQLDTSIRTGRKSITATLGLVVHAAADGVAMGAAASGSRADIQMIVFIAIMLHKAPAAFGLVTFLMHENYERNRIRKHLLIFSLAAPVVAIISYFSLSHASKEALLSVNATGLSMLFSAGTFLYVATVHVLPEIVAPSHHSAPSGDVESGTETGNGITRTELVALICSCLSPLILSMGHHH